MATPECFLAGIRRRLAAWKDVKCQAGTWRWALGRLLVTFEPLQRVAEYLVFGFFPGLIKDGPVMGNGLAKVSSVCCESSFGTR